MKTTEKVIVGSRYFFEDYFDDFKPHDSDEFCWCLDDSDFKFKTQLHLRGNEIGDCFIWKPNTPEWFINYHKKDCKLPMEIGKWLIPEVGKYIGFTFEHLKQLKEEFNNLDKKHTYEKLIFDFYLENNDMFLNEEQRKVVYEEYKRSREQ